MSPNQPLKSTGTLRARPDGSLLLAVASDSHSTPHPAAPDLIAALHPDAILHAGDIGDLKALDVFSAIAPLFVVRGNVDQRAPDLPDVMIIDVESSEQLVLRIFMTHVGLFGPRLQPEVARHARHEHAGLVVCGHSHLPFIGRYDGLTVFNPGSIGPRRFQLPIVFGIIALSASGIRLSHVDCETGQSWVPPQREPQ